MSFSKPENMPLKINSDGSDNNNYIDLLDEDRAIAGQKFACLSFISPEDILKQKNNFLFEKFLNKWDFSKSLEKYNQFLNFISYKYNLDSTKVTEDLQEFLKDEKANLINTSIEDEYKTFIDNNEDALDKEFGEKYSFQTNVRGIKVRGVFPTQQEAELRCKMLRQNDPNHDVYVGPVGMWVPFHPEAYKTGRVEYMEETLNELMSEKKKNEDKAKDAFDQRIKDTKKKAIEENIEKATASGNKLSQTINEDGELVSVRNMTSVNNISENATPDDIRAELFEGDNIVTSKNSDKGLSLLQ